MNRNKTISRTTADLGLLSVTLFWGTTFILSKLILGEISLLKYLAVRLSLAAFFMLVLSVHELKYLQRNTVKHGIILGIFLFLSYFFQMWGIQFTSASNAGFITGLSVVFVPVFSVLFFGERPRISSLFGVGLATIGLYFLSGGNFMALNFGDFLVLICSVFVTFHVIFTGNFASQNNIALLTLVQLTTIAVLSLVLVMFDQTPAQIYTMNNILILVYFALFGTVFTFFMQTAMQRFTTATRTALVFSMEPVFAALFAFIIAGETLSSLGWIGGVFILAGMLIAEFEPDFMFFKRS